MSSLRPALAALIVAAVALSGCGGSEESRPDTEATLVLDFQPNAVHSGIYLATSRGYDAAEGVDLTVRAPSSSTDSVKLLLGRRADFAILDIHDLALARAKGRDVVGVMAIVQTPLAAVLTQPGITRPRELEGKRVGVSGLPSDEAVLRSIVEGDGGDASKVRTLTIGFNAVPSLLARKVDGVTAFWNAEGVAVRSRPGGEAFGEFRVERFGAPSYPELVLTTSRRLLQDRPEVVRATVTALSRGYEETLRDPESATAALVDAEPDLTRAAVQRELDAVAPSFRSGDRRVGVLDPVRLAEWARWELEFGIVSRPLDPAQAFAPAFSMPIDRPR